MTRGRQLLVRAGITAAVAAGLAAVLASSNYAWDFRPSFEYRGLYFGGLRATLSATALAFALGLGGGAGIALARMSRRLWLRHLGDLYVELVRGTPLLVQIMIAYFGVAPLLGIDSKFWVGTIALGAFAAAYMGEVFRAGIESVERGQFEAARALGLSRARTMRHVILPQAVKRMIPPLTGELIALVKESSLLFAIGVTEMMFAARQIASKTYKSFEPYLVVAAMYLTITIPLSLLARRLERRLGRSTRTLEHP
ncbi:MAG: amino acid ABC transporter permease [Planctomycetaceae bacterium]